MRRRCKRLLAVLFVVLLLSCVCSEFCLAANAKVYADKVTANKGETVLIPVKISGNPGIMGYRIIIKYPDEVFSEPSVERGTVCGNGNFNDSISEKTAGSFDVLWNSSGDVKTDGILFTVSLKVISDDAQKSKILISYSKQDTFNENWQSVDLDCEDAEVLLNGYKDPAEPVEPIKEKRSERIKKWAAGVVPPLNIIMKIIVAPLVFIISLFE